MPADKKHAYSKFPNAMPPYDFLPLRHYLVDLLYGPINGKFLEYIFPSTIYY